MEGLSLKLDTLSAASPEGTNSLILYGGMNGDVPMWKIAKGASNCGQGYYFISDTEAGLLPRICSQFLQENSRIFLTKQVTEDLAGKRPKNSKLLLKIHLVLPLQKTLFLFR